MFVLLPPRSAFFSWIEGRANRWGLGQWEPLATPAGLLGPEESVASGCVSPFRSREAGLSTAGDSFAKSGLHFFDGFMSWVAPIDMVEDEVYSFQINEGARRINHPFGNGSYHLLVVVWGMAMVYYCFTSFQLKTHLELPPMASKGRLGPWRPMDAKQLGEKHQGGREDLCPLAAEKSMGTAGQFGKTTRFWWMFKENLGNMWENLDENDCPEESLGKPSDLNSQHYFWSMFEKNHLIVQKKETWDFNWPEFRISPEVPFQRNLGKEVRLAGGISGGTVLILPLTMVHVWG